MRILLIRHGDPDYVNDTLTEKGRREAALLAKRAVSMNMGECYKSPLGRAKDTADAAQIVQLDYRVGAVAACALGVGDKKIMFKHILPNAMIATLTFMPYLFTGALTTLTSLDFLGFGLPLGSASLGEMVAQGKDNLHAPWLAITAFISLSTILVLLVFIGEATRDAFDPRKTL